MTNNIKEVYKVEGINYFFGILKNIVWTSEGPFSLEDFHIKQKETKKINKHVLVHSVDKFPRMTDYVILSDVRIADANRVRLGAYLGSGTTVMHEGFVNFNAGSLGEAMIEGRISQGVVIGDKTDIGGGASTMGTLSGGNEVKISLGKNCLLGANSGLGIPLGDRCTVEAGLYLTAASKVEMVNEQGEITDILKASDLSSKSDLLFIRNSLSGSIQCRPNKNIAKLKKFSKEKFKVFHPGGNIGGSLLLAKDIMVTGNKMPVINQLFLNDPISSSSSSGRKIPSRDINEFSIFT